MTQVVSLSLISHTNAGKTTLARTLLGRDVGEVRDAPHVTEFAEDYVLLQTPEGDALTLWDTPGFGDSVRLLKRLKAQGNPMRWFLSEVWDRFRDRPFHASQTAMRNVRDRADVVLYLVDASQSPEAAGYIQAEMALLAWLNKPVVVMLNQLGTPREGAGDDAEVSRWREHLKTWPLVRAVLPLDAFTRCWVQEFAWLDAVALAAPSDKVASLARLQSAWQAQRLQTFEAAMGVLAQSLVRVAALREAMPASIGVRGTLRQVGHAAKSLWNRATATVGAGQDGEGASAAAPMAALAPEVQAAQQALASRTTADVQASLAELIALHGLQGRAQRELDEIIQSHFEMKLHFHEGQSALVGGVVTGALGGLVADVGSGGLTLGGGMLTGAVVGALAAATAAHGINVRRGRQHAWITWHARAMQAMVVSAMLRYLAVAHFGRGRGAWQQGAAPAHWRATVERVVASQRQAWDLLWTERDEGDDASPGQVQPAAVAALLREAMVGVLIELYPDSKASLLRSTQDSTKQSPSHAPLFHTGLDDQDDPAKI
jgi:hypothetical protein